MQDLVAGPLWAVVLLRHRVQSTVLWSFWWTCFGKITKWISKKTTTSWRWPACRLHDNKTVFMGRGQWGLTIVAIATGPAVLGAPRSSVINLIYYIIYENLFSLRSQCFAKFSISRKRRFSIERCLCPEIRVWCFLYRRNKRHKIAVSSVAILADLLLYLAGFSHC